MARAVRVNGKVEPVFVEAISDMPQAILDAARAGDVVVPWGRARSVAWRPELWLWFDGKQGSARSGPVQYRTKVMKQYGKVAVMMGGSSSEREVSLMSGNGVLSALLSRGVDAHAFDPSQKPLAALKGEGFDRVFIALHGPFGEDGRCRARWKPWVFRTPAVA